MLWASTSTVQGRPFFVVPHAWPSFRHTLACGDRRRGAQLRCSPAMRMPLVAAQRTPVAPIQHTTMCLSGMYWCDRVVTCGTRAMRERGRPAIRAEAAPPCREVRANTMRGRADGGGNTSPTSRQTSGQRSTEKDNDLNLEKHRGGPAACQRQRSTGCSGECLDSLQHRRAGRANPCPFGRRRGRDAPGEQPTKVVERVGAPARRCSTQIWPVATTTPLGSPGWARTG